MWAAGHLRRGAAGGCAAGGGCVEVQSRAGAGGGAYAGDGRLWAFMWRRGAVCVSEK